MPELLGKLYLLFFGDAESFAEQILQKFAAYFVVVELDCGVGFYYFLLYELL